MPIGASFKVEELSTVDYDDQEFNADRDCYFGAYSGGVKRK